LRALKERGRRKRARSRGGRNVVMVYVRNMKDYEEMSVHNSRSREWRQTAYLRDPQSRSMTRMLYNVMAAKRTSVELR